MVNTSGTCGRTKAIAMRAVRHGNARRASGTPHDLCRGLVGERRDRGQEGEPPGLRTGGRLGNRFEETVVVGSPRARPAVVGGGPIRLLERFRGADAPVQSGLREVSQPECERRLTSYERRRFSFFGGSRFPRPGRFAMVSRNTQERCLCLEIYNHGVASIRAACLCGGGGGFVMELGNACVLPVTGEPAARQRAGRPGDPPW